MLEINAKQDFLMPFVRIGDEGWDLNTRIILEAYAENWDEPLSEPKTDADIFALEKKLGAALPDSLKVFYQHFGTANIGEILQTFDDIDWLKSTWSDAPEYGPDFTELDNEVLPYLISFSDYLGSGNMFCYHAKTHQIFYYDHDQKPYISKMFDCIDDYLRGCLIYMQSDLFGADITQDTASRWALEIQMQLFGAAIVCKWHY
jgi:hypothetical protein